LPSLPHRAFVETSLVEEGLADDDDVRVDMEDVLVELDVLIDFELALTDDAGEPVQSPCPDWHPVPQYADVEPLQKISSRSVVTGLYRCALYH
jgi:hypothetical protein